MPPPAKNKILIVDDHTEAREAMAALLQDEFDVNTLDSAEHLQEAVEKYQPDVVLLDISMPKVNGLTAARRLRDAGSDVKIIFVTEHGDPQYVKEAFRAGGSGFVVKSRASSQIRPALQRVLAGARFPSASEEFSGSPRQGRKNSSTS